MTTAAEDAKTIRQQYKALGWGRNEVSVRCSNFSMGSSVTVEIKSPEVDHIEARAIAEGVAERIHRCTVTGEILGGGNRYVHVQHSEGCREILARRHVDALGSALDEVALQPKGSATHIPIAGCEGASVARATSSWGFMLWTEPDPDRPAKAGPQFDDDRSSHGHSVRSAAVSLALAQDERRRRTERAKVTAAPSVVEETAGPGFKLRPSSLGRDGVVEVVFDEKPSDEIRAALKGRGFRWARRNSCWYGQRDALPEILGGDSDETRATRAMCDAAAEAEGW